jgi:hypothetical protein
MSSINGINQSSIENFTELFNQPENNVSTNQTNGFSNLSQDDGNKLNDILSKLIDQIMNSEIDDDFGDSDDSLNDPKIQQGFNDLQAKRDKGETGDLFAVVKDSNGKDTLIALRKNGEAEVVDPAKYNVKTAQEAFNVEKGVAETETKLKGLADRKAKGEKGDLFDKVSVNGQEKLLVLRENGQTEINDAAKYGVKTADEAINVEKSIKVTQEKFTKLQEKRDKGEKGDLYDSIEVNGKQKLLALRENGQAEIVDFAKYKQFGVSETTLPKEHHSGFLGIGSWDEDKNAPNIQKAIDADKVTQSMQKGMQNLQSRRENGEAGTLYSSAEGGQFKFLLKLDKNNQPDAINYQTYQVDTEKGAITVDKKVDEMREANPGKAVKFSVDTGETHGKSGFLGIGHWDEANKTTLSLDAAGKINGVETNRNDHGGTFFGDLLGWVAPIASLIFPPLAPIVAAINGVKSLAEGNILGAITGIAGGIGGAVGNIVSKVAGGVQGVINGIQTGDWFSALKSGVGVVGNFAQGTFKTGLDTFSGLVDKGKNLYEGVTNALTGGNFFDSVKSGLGVVSSLSQGAFKNTVDTLGGWVDKGKDLYNGITNVFNGEGGLTDKIRGALTGIQSFGGKAVSGLVDGANGILNKFNGAIDGVSNLVSGKGSLVTNLTDILKNIFSGDEDKKKITNIGNTAGSIENLINEVIK